MSVDQSIAVESTLPTAWSRSRIGSFLSQPVSWVFLIVGGIIGFLESVSDFFSLLRQPDGRAAWAARQFYLAELCAGLC